MKLYRLLLLALIGLAALVPARLVLADDIALGPEGFEFLIDLSRSMNQVHGDATRFFSAISLISRINAVLPEQGQKAALRKFGHRIFGGQGEELIWGVSDFEAARLPLERLTTGTGYSPLDRAMEASQSELAEMPGKKALLIFSDFGKSVAPAETLAAAKALTEKFGEDLRIVTFWFGGESEAADRAASIAAASKNGLAYDGHKLLENFDDFKNMILTVFTVPAVRTAVSATGSRAAAVQATEPIKQFFDFDEARIKDESLPSLEEAAGILKNNPRAVAMVTGHTDSVGTEEYNIELGRARAAAIKLRLQDMGVEPARIVISSKGEAEPGAGNDSDQGRALNRRTVIEIIFP